MQWHWSPAWPCSSSASAACAHCRIPGWATEPARAGLAATPGPRRRRPVYLPASRPPQRLPATSPMSDVPTEAARRRTFAITSHPDARKTPLTERLLLFGGAIQMAGSVKGRKAARHATSDWMALEKERGISVTSSVMQFPYEGRIVNLLDTPGHADFGEDTYRVLT